MMDTEVKRHTVLLVDDETNILNAMKRLLRREPYNLLTACSGKEGLEMLDGRQVSLILSDQRMPGMNGTEFLSLVKKRHPDIIRIILSGYTEVDTISDAVNRGQIYKFFLKPWNDESIKLEIRKALEQFDLIESNRKLSETVMLQNRALRSANEQLEEMVSARTRELELRNSALELSRAMLDDFPFPVFGVSSDEMVVYMNLQAYRLQLNGSSPQIGEDIREVFGESISEAVSSCSNQMNDMAEASVCLADQSFRLILSPLSGRFHGHGMVVTFIPMRS